MVTTYDNGYSDDNVYGVAVRLLTRAASGNGIHLDIGCGFGRMAEPLRDATGAEYLGFDFDEDGLTSLSNRGFEVKKIDLTDLTSAEAILVDAIRGRSVRSMSIIDVLEHVPDPASTMRMLRRIAGLHACPLVVAVPNVTHQDVGMKLAFGRWDITLAGILDHTHLQFYTRGRLNDIAASAGWHEFDGDDLISRISDQHFPADHPVLAENSLLGQFLRTLGQSANRDAHVYQFVRSFLPGPIREPMPLPKTAEGPQPYKPFLSVVTRTQGTRIHQLSETLLSLTAQTCQDFEVLVLGHRLDLEGQLRVERVIADLPTSMRNKTRLILVDHGNRTTPLNVGFTTAQGRYACIVDDDDVVFGHWVETWRDLAAKNPGRLLRANVARQDFTNVDTAYTGHLGFAATGGMILYPAEFDLFAHLIENHTPGLGMAFPLAAFQELNIRFDEDLTTCEDWDLFIRTGLVCGFATTKEVVAIYRWWKNAGNSTEIHSQEEWIANRDRICSKLDRMPVLLPPGTTRYLRKMLSSQSHLFFATESEQTIHTENLRQNVELLLKSSSWRATAPLRGTMRIFRRSSNLPPLDTLNASQLRQLSLDIQRSTSWRITKPLRAAKRVLQSAAEMMRLS
jgi:hypothetical protein